MSIVEESGAKRGLGEKLTLGIDKIIWGLYKAEAGKTSSETFSARFSGLVNKSSKSLLVVDSQFLSANDLRLAAKRGVSVEVISKDDWVNPVLKENLETNGVKVHLLEPQIFDQINPRFIVADGKNIMFMALKKEEYAYVERSGYLGKMFSKDFKKLTKPV